MFCLHILLCALRVAQGGSLLFQCLFALLCVFFQLADLLLSRRKPPLEDVALGLILIVRLIDTFLCLLLKPLGEMSHQIAQLLVDIRCRGLRGFELLQIAVNGGFRPRITHFDTYRIDAGVFASGQQGRPCFLY